MQIPENILKSIPFQYAENVKNGKIVTGKNIKLAVTRFYTMLDNLETKNYRLNHLEGMSAITFCEYFLQHTKGPVAGEQFTLSPYQQFAIYNIMAFQKQDTKGKWVRVVKTIYEKVARKNGKTALLAALGLYFMSLDGESSPEIYVGATKEAQAKILWEQAHQFVFKSQKLRLAGYDNTQREIRFKHQSGVFRFLGGDSKTQDGLSPNFVALDEYHAHPTDGVREVLESAMGARLQPIMYIITTAGFNTASVCKQYEDVCKDILLGLKEDDSTFIMIHDLDEGDDWENPDNWAKANPNLGVSISLDYLKTEYQKAKNQPSKIPNFKTKHLNMWVDAPEVWIPDEIWMQNATTEDFSDKFKELGSVSATDLSTTTDLTADVYLTYPDADGKQYLKVNVYCPLDTIDRRSKEDRVPYRAWKDEGYLIATPGNTVDYTILEDHKLQNQSVFNVKMNEFDKWNASQLMNSLTEKGLEVSEFSQSITTISYPTKQFEKLVYEGKIIHDGNPILRWALASCVIYRDANENIKVHKGQSHANGRRVDPIIASIMALGGTLTPQENNESQYNNQSEAYI